MEGQTGTINAVESFEQEVVRLREENTRLIEENAELKEKNGALTLEARYDERTGLKNGHAFKEDLKLIFHSKRENAPERREQKQEDNVCVLMIDIDKFKNVNDSYGHGAGDKVLREVGDRLKTSIRDNDVIARYGGDEIIVILTGASEDQAKDKAEKLRMLIENEKFNFNNALIPVTISVGITFGDRDSNPFTLITEADKALYESKENGRNKVTTYSKT